MAATDPAARAPSFLGPPLLWLTRLGLRFPRATIVLALGLAGLSIWVTCTRLEYRTSRLDLLNPNSDYNRLWIEYLEEFGDEDDVVVVVEGPDRDTVVPVLREVAEELAQHDTLFHAVLHGVDLSRIRSKGLHYLQPAELTRIETFLEQARPILDGDWTVLNVGHMLGELSQQFSQLPYAPPEAEEAAGQQLQRLTASLRAMLTGSGEYPSPWPEMPQGFATLSELNSEYLLTKEGRVGFVLLRIAPGEHGFARGTEATLKLRELLAEVNARHAETHVGLTGLPVMEHDEMQSSQTSMVWASLLSVVGVAILFVAGFGGVRHAVLANLVLLIGIAWSFGYVTLVVGHLNILSMSFTVTLVGIGIDYGVYYVSRYLQVRRTIPDTHAALVATTTAVGPAILTGAITTAISFFMAGCTSFTGVAELGIIAGGGILLCGLAELVVLPATLQLVDRARLANRFPQPLPVHTWVTPLLATPRILLVSTLAFTAVVSLGIEHLWYDHNLLNLQAAGLESVQLERKLLEESDQSSWYALSVADNEQELLERKAALLRLASVERTEEIVSLLPTDLEAKQPVIRRLQASLAGLPERPPLIPVVAAQELGRSLAALEEVLASSGDHRGADELLDLRDRLRKLPAATCYDAVSRFQQHMAGDLLTRLHTLRRMANPEPPQLADLPASLVNRFVGHHGKHLLKIYGRGNLWDMPALASFVREVRSVDPRATGNPLQAYEASLEMKASYQSSAVYALAVILLVLLIDFRSLKDALLAALPLALGVAQMFGLMGILDIPLNPANMIALPLILGIGVDYGVHIVHEYREHSGPYRLSQATAVAVLVDALTTIVGFGSLMVASHQGLQSLGRVLTIGVSCCLFTSLLMLPAWLTWITAGRPEQFSGEHTSTAETGSSDTYRRHGHGEPPLRDPDWPALHERGESQRMPHGS